ncbi:hypothetical protein EN857_30080 [Mesorhizobium sp. M4B.F.Ca.ET.214.01.1.1]|nr:hypothetical protein EN857_30080 [Mesorhizobium sp. M4B.F.Ca.ET.214.01.1.1]TGQ56450.1 hypothetical protein EN854_29945 [Mesorhizobium sp. M4B.F.Ca.ET.211.01.1.1]TGU29795.1 hypothetical protein EN793_29925 [Mesorhizobium sp. M4B.F.Ca.ET.150.01.1.1]
MASSSVSLAPFLSLRRGERCRCEAATEWGKAVPKYAAADNSPIRAKHHPARNNDAGAGRPPLRRASLDTSPPIDGGEERRPSCSHWLFNPETGGCRPSSA